MEREKWGNGRGRGFFLCRKSRAKSGAKTSQPRCDWFHKDEKWESRNLSRTQLLLDLACRIPATFLWPTLFSLSLSINPKCE